MACRTARMEDGTKIFFCGDIEDWQICRVCGDAADVLCDYPIEEDKTCSSALCKFHCVGQGGDLHYCNEHSQYYGKVIELILCQDGGGI